MRVYQSTPPAACPSNRAGPAPPHAPPPAALPHDLHDPTPPSLLAAPSPTPTARRRFRPSMALPMALGTHHALPMDLGTVVTRRPEVRSRISRPREHPMDLVNGPDPSPQCAEPVQVAGV